MGAHLRTITQYGLNLGGLITQAQDNIANPVLPEQSELIVKKWEIDYGNYRFWNRESQRPQTGPFTAC
jgi:hypothetical protein